MRNRTMSKGRYLAAGIGCALAAASVSIPAATASSRAARPAATASSRAARPAARHAAAAAHAAAASTCTASIGDVGPYTGTVAALGDEQLDFAKLAIMRFNAQYHTNLTLVEEDDQFIPAQTVTKVQELISNPAIVATEGPATTAGVEATGTLLKRAGLAAVSPSATQEDIVKGSYDFPTMFTVVGSAWTEAPAVGGYLVKVLHAKRVFIVDDESSFAIVFAKTVGAYL
ncbi:MAG TPA: ABC transporter substrate-binding protein, partial [Acidimicrobiales bacterium]|nr:ABC transporter substrate-binding protein [Acidimicrobiales bacterium]